MPTMDGYEAAKEIREMMAANMISSNSIIIANSAYNEEQQCKSKGTFDRFLEKPIIITELLRILEDVL